MLEIFNLFLVGSSKYLFLLYIIYGLNVLRKENHGNSLTIKLNFFGHRHCKIPCMLTSF